MTSIQTSVGLQQLQDQINKLKSQIQQLDKRNREQYGQINSLLYSGNNYDENGKQIPNPSLQSYSKVILHNDQTKETIIQIQTQEGWWQSLTYSGEYVKYKNGVITERVNQSKQFYADFDYRFYKQSKNVFAKENLFNKVKTSIKAQHATVFNSGYESCSSLIQKLEILVTFTCDYETIKSKLESYIQDHYTFYHKEITDTRILIQDNNEINTLIKIIDAYSHILQYCKQKVTFLNEEEETQTVNLFENVTQSIYVKNCTNLECLFEESVINMNIILIDCDKITIGSSQNLTLQNCKNISIGNSSFQGNVYLNNLQNVFIDNNFCKDGGEMLLQSNLTQEQFETSFMKIEKNSFQKSSSYINLFDNYFINICQNSFASSTNLINLQLSTMTLQEECCNNSTIQIQNCLVNGFLHVLKYGLSNGSLIMDPESFADGVCSFAGVPTTSPYQQQLLHCSSTMKMFFTRNYFINIDFVYGTKNVIQDSIWNVQAGIYDNGVFSLNQYKYSLRNNQYLLRQDPCITEGDKSTSYMLGYHLQNLRRQQFEDWDYLPIQETAINNQINFIFNGTGYEKLIEEYIYENNVLKIKWPLDIAMPTSSQVADSSFKITNLYIMDFIQTDINITSYIFYNGTSNSPEMMNSLQTINFEFPQNMTIVQIAAPITLEGLSILADATTSLTKFILNYPTSQQQNVKSLTSLDIPDLFISKMELQQYQFYGVNIDNLYKFVDLIDIFQKYCFKEATIKRNGQFIIKNNIPEGCFYGAKTTASSLYFTKNLIIQDSGFYGFKQINSGALSIQCMSGILLQFQDMKQFKNADVSSISLYADSVPESCFENTKITLAQLIPQSSSLIIRKNAFYNCSSLNTISFITKITSVTIESGAFYNTSFTTLNGIDTTDQITIGDKSFENSSLASIDFINDYTQFTGNNVFQHLQTSGTVMLIYDRSTSNVNIDFGSILEQAPLQNIIAPSSDTILKIYVKTQELKEAIDLKIALSDQIFHNYQVEVQE